jgi:translation initiation factor IF-1
MGWVTVAAAEDDGRIAPMGEAATLDGADEAALAHNGVEIRIRIRIRIRSRIRIREGK